MTYDRVYLPAQGAMAWYYLFFNKDFDSGYIGKFKLDARIAQSHKTYYVENSCPSQALQNEQLTGKVLVIDNHDCVKDSRYTQIDSIKGINDLLSYKVLIPAR